MKYKMIAMDMDGTLIPKDGSISKRNIDMINAAAEKGIKIVICTGRMYCSAIQETGGFPDNITIISSNGAYIKDKYGLNPIYAMPMGEKKIINVIALCRKYDIGFQLYSWDKVFSEKRSRYYSALDTTYPYYRKLNVVKIEQNGWGDLVRNNNNILKAFILDGNEDKLDKLINDLKSVDVESVKMGDDCIEVMNKGVTKGKGIEYLAGLYNIKRDEIICIGDNENDISMIKYAGLGVAMGNAEDTVKTAADYITLTDMEDGVAHVFDKFVLTA